MAGSWDLAWEAVNRHGAMQRTGELAAALDVVAGLDPHDRICEIGCHAGGTLWAWRQLAAHVCGITLPVPGPEYVHRHGAALLFADSHARLARRWVTDLLGSGRLDVLFIDGDHTTDGCLADWADYGPLVRPGGLILVHDIACPGEPGVRPGWDVIAAAWPGQCRELPPDETDPVGFGVIEVTEGMFHAGGPDRAPRRRVQAGRAAARGH